MARHLNTDAQRDGALWIRWAAKQLCPVSFKTEALSTISLRTIASVMKQKDDEDGFHLFGETVLLRSGIRLGIIETTGSA